MSVQVRRRREAASFLSSYVGAQGELLVDTTNNRVQVHDGATPGGWPAAKLADVIGRTTVADVAYTAKVTDRTIAITSLTMPRIITLPAAAAYPTGTNLTIVDESGACATLAVSIAAAGTDTINGIAAWPIATAYGYVALESNGVGRWTVVDAPGTARTAVADANYTALASDRTIAFTALTAARTVTLSAAAAYPTGTQLLVVDESGACSFTNTITIAAAGTDTIDGGASATVGTLYGFLAFASNGVGKWTIVDRAINKPPTQTVLTGSGATGTYTPPVGASWLRVILVGAGGGGAASGTSPGAATAGGATSFGTLTCAGGAVASGSTGGAAAGAPTGGDINIGGNGGNDGVTGVAGMVFPGGQGGSSPYGGSRVQAGGVGGKGTPNTGAGGSGGGASGAMAAGGGGGAGANMQKIIAAPAASYAYTVGAQGTAGTAGSGGFAGGNGSAGLIIVEEHYD